MDATAAEDLGRLIQQWLGGNSIRSQRMLAQKTNVGLATINRLVSLEDAKEKPVSLDIGLKILPVICKNDEMMRYLENHFHKQAEVLKRIYSEKETEDTVYFSADFARHLRDPIAFRIITLASNHSGIARTELIKKLGLVGEEALENLVNEGVLYEDAVGRIRNFVKEWSANDYETAIAEYRMCGDNFLRTKNGVLSILSEAVNEEGLGDIKDVLKDAIQKICEIKQDPRKQGDIPIAVTLLQTFMD